MTWRVLFHPEFVGEYKLLGEHIRDDLVAATTRLQELGPSLGRPTVDTLKGSKFRNMKELRVEVSDGEWRFAFAFDPKQDAIVLYGGDKRGISPTKFYKGLIAKADGRYAEWLKKQIGP